MQQAQSWPLQAGRVEAAREQLEVFRQSLEAFALKHREEVRRDPVFRARFHEMCRRVGVDPLASNKGVWAQLLGIGDFYYELAVQVVEAGMRAREEGAGGLVELGALAARVRAQRGGAGAPVTEDDVAQAVRKLGVLGGGFELVRVGRSKTFVRSVPGELNLDQNAVLARAEGDGWVTRAALLAPAAEGGEGWGAERADACLQQLLAEGQALVDDGAPGGERRFWFPCHWDASAGAPAAA